MSKYSFTYGVSRTDSDNTEVAEEFSLEGYPATAEAMSEDRYAVTHEFTAEDDDDAKEQMEEIMDMSLVELFDVYSLKRGSETILTEEDEE